METKICKDCKQVKLVEEFPIHKYRDRLARRSRCIPCYRNYMKTYNEKRRAKPEKRKLSYFETISKLLFTKQWTKNIFKGVSDEI